MGLPLKVILSFPPDAFNILSLFYMFLIFNYNTSNGVSFLILSVWSSVRFFYCMDVSFSKFGEFSSEYFLPPLLCYFPSSVFSV